MIAIFIPSAFKASIKIVDAFFVLLDRLAIGVEAINPITTARDPNKTEIPACKPKKPETINAEITEILLNFISIFLK